MRCCPHCQIFAVVCHGLGSTFDRPGCIFSVCTVISLPLGLELIVLGAGAGVPQDAGVAQQLMQRASDGGYPAAQADLGFLSALGLKPSPLGSLSFGQPDIPR